MHDCTLYCKVLYICVTKANNMKATKTQIAQITEAAIANNVNVESALSHLEKCSASIFKAIGINGVIEAAKKTSSIVEGNNVGGVLVSLCTIVGQSEKAYLMVIPKGVGVIEKWIAKSIIAKSSEGSDYIPFWAIK